MIYLILVTYGIGWVLATAVCVRWALVNVGLDDVFATTFAGVGAILAGLFWPLLAAGYCIARVAEGPGVRSARRELRERAK